MAKKKPPSILSEALLRELLIAQPPIDMPPKRQRHIKKSLLANVAAIEKLSPILSRDITTVRAGSGEWQHRSAGIDMQILFDDGHTMTRLVRFVAGARLASHRHCGNEESTVLEGSCYVGDLLLKQGDYQLALDGTVHEEVHSPDGCILLVRSASMKVHLPAKSMPMHG